MSWATHRKEIIIGIIGVVVVALIALISIATFYKTPTCSDQKQNQSEEGVDCGGPCARACVASMHEPVVRFVRVLTQTNGRADVLAYIDNPNSAAAKAAPYTLTLYATDTTKVVMQQGTIDLSPRSMTPLYLPGLSIGSASVARAFLTFDTASTVWYRYPDNETPLSVRGVVWNDTETPRVNAVIENASALPIYRVPVVIAVFDGSGNVVGASQTVLDRIPAFGNTTAIFTWNESFASPRAREEITPILPVDWSLVQGSL